MKTFSILITTKDRIEELKFTLQKITHLIEREDVESIICNDGSSDQISAFVKKNYPKIKLIEHKNSKGLIASRNELLAITNAKYAITLDDDANIMSKKPLEEIEQFFKHNPNCAVIAFRIFWGKKLPNNLNHQLTKKRVKGFVGCGHVWRMDAWRTIPNYPGWFVFYGEEDFAAFQLLKKGWEIYYVPKILVHHRVDLKARKNDKDYRLRLRRSLRSGWYLYFLFYPWKLIPKKFLYTLWIQLKKKVFKGDWKALFAIMQAMGDVLINLPKLLSNSNKLNEKEFREYSKLPNAKVYWTPKDNQKIL